MKPVLVLDIETFPVDDPVLDNLLTYKVRNVPEDQKEEKRNYYKFIHPVYARVLVIGTLRVGPSGVPEERVFLGDEETILQQFATYISQFKGVFVHFNGLKFDVPFLLTRFVKHGIDIENNSFCNLTHFRTFPHYDVMQVLSNWREFPINLKEACYLFGIENPKTILNDMQVTDFLYTCSEEELVEYVMGDVRAIYEIYNKINLLYT